VIRLRKYLALLCVGLPGVEKQVSKENEREFHSMIHGKFMMKGGSFLIEC
jgi:hypothetical protein